MRHSSTIDGLRRALPLLAVLAALACAVPALAVSQYDGLPVLEKGYSASGPEEWTIPTATFGAKPDPATLSDGERYVLYGAGKSDAVPTGIGPQWMLMWGYVQTCFTNLGYVPEAMTPEVLAAAFGKPVSEIGPKMPINLRSPITGEYPVLNSPTFVRGGYDFRLLTEAEQHLLAARCPSFSQAWFEGVHQDLNGDGTKERVKCGPPFYVRVYGEHDVILEQVMFTMEKLED